MVFSSFRVWLAVGEFVREGQVPFLYCSFWFMKSGKRVLGSKGELKGSKGEHMPREQGDPRVAPTGRGAHGGKGTFLSLHPEISLYVSSASSNSCACGAPESMEIAAFRA